MPFRYLGAPNDGPLLQGELIGPVVEYRPLDPPIDLPEGETTVPIRFVPVVHDLMVVMTALCDLEQDFKRRVAIATEHEGRANPEAGEAPIPQFPDHPHLVPHVLLCDAFERSKVRPRFQSSTLWEQVGENHDDRYHHLLASGIGIGDDTPIAEVYLDFKKSLAIPTELLYEGIRRRQIRRLRVIPDVYLHNLIHRYYSFLSRIGLPD